MYKSVGNNSNKHINEHSRRFEYLGKVENRQQGNPRMGELKSDKEDVGISG